MSHGGLADILFLLGAAIVVVTCFKKLNLSPVLGYLFAGIVIGPFGLGFVEYTSTTAYIAEFGIVFLLFYIGLELSFDRLKSMRTHVFGLGFLQVLLTSALFIGICYLLGLSLALSIVIGSALSLSSTAVVLKVLAEQNDEMSKVGRTSIAVLIFQDIIVVFLLVLVPLLAAGDNEKIVTTLGQAGIRAALALCAIILVGKFLIRPLFQFVGKTRSEELFSATTLVVVLGSAFATEHYGLSLALGAFLAGLMMAETEFRHQVEADIMPYKSLLLGLFFMSVGMLIDVELLYEKAPEIIGIALGILTLKGFIIFILCRLFGLKLGQALHAGLILAQVGEFAFILFGMANKKGLMDNNLYQELLVATALTMALTPLMAILGKRAARRLNPAIKLSTDELLTEVKDLNNHIIICGYGRVGRVVAKVLTARREAFIVIDSDSTNVREGRKNGRPVLFGDASKKEILEAVGLKRAKAVVLTMNDKKIASRLANIISDEIPALPIIARAWDTEHVKQLEKAGVKHAVAEAYELGLVISHHVLEVTGTEEAELDRTLKSFRNDDYALLKALAAGKKPT